MAAMMKDDRIDQRFKVLLLCTVAALLVSIVISIAQFGVPLRAERSRIGFVLLAGKDDAGWNHSHYAGIKSACSELHMELLLRDHVPERAGACKIAVQDLIQQGCRVIFLPSYGHLPEVMDIVQAHPEVRFCTNSAKYRGANIMAYAVRLYQARYLAGIVAGRQTKSGVIGYVTALASPEVDRGVNAFTLGVQRVNPTARVKLIRTGFWNAPDEEREAVHRLLQARADVLTYQVDGYTVADEAEAAGVDFIGANELRPGTSGHQLTTVLCSWDRVYLDILQKLHRREAKPAGFYWSGLEQDMVGLAPFSDRVAPETAAAVEAARQEIVEGKHIFSGELYDQSGQLRCRAGEAIPDEVLLRQVDWLVKGVDVLE